MEEELIKIIKSDIPLKSVQRRYKNIVNKEGNNIKVPRQQIIVTFDKLDLPQYIYIYKLRHNVDIWYSPVTQCFNCLRFGHTSNQCKSKKKCKNCGDDLSEGKIKCDSCKVSCIHCNTEGHNSTSKECPEFIKQKRTKETMANLNLSFKEAEKIVDNPSYASLVNKNKFAPLMSSNIDFPNLPTQKNSSLSLNKNMSNNRSNNNNHSSQPRTSYSGLQSNKKRKSCDLSPNFEPISREFDWNYTGAPITHHNKTLGQPDITDLKNKIQECLKNRISSSIQSLTPPNMVNILENIDISYIIEHTLGELFQKWIQ